MDLLEWIRKDPKIHQQTHDKLLVLAREAANDELDAVIRKVVALHKKRGMLDSHKLARLTAEAQKLEARPDPVAAGS